MKYIIFTLLTAVITFSSFFVQEAEKKEQKSNTKYSAKNIGSTQAVEGDFGSIQLPNGVPSTTTNKLYNNGGSLFFNGASLASAVSSVDSLNHLADARFDGSSLFF